MNGETIQLADGLSLRNLRVFETEQPHLAGGPNYAAVEVVAELCRDGDPIALAIDAEGKPLLAIIRESRIVRDDRDTGNVLDALGDAFAAFLRSTRALIEGLD